MEGFTVVFTSLIRFSKATLSGRSSLSSKFSPLRILSTNLPGMGWSAGDRTRGWVLSRVDGVMTADTAGANELATVATSGIEDKALVLGGIENSGTDVTMGTGGSEDRTDGRVDSGPVIK